MWTKGTLSAATICGAQICMVLVASPMTPAPWASSERAILGEDSCAAASQLPSRCSASMGAKSTEWRMTGRGVQAAQARRRLAVEDGIVMSGRFPAHAADEADGFHGVLLARQGLNRDVNYPRIPAGTLAKAFTTSR